MYNTNSGYGMLQAMAIANGVQTLGKIFLVLPAADANYDKWSQILKVDPEGDVRLFVTLEEAYAEVVSNRGDVIFLGGNGSHSVATGIAWTKNRVNVIGLDGGGRFLQQGAKVQLTGAVDSAYVVKNTGVRNNFRNIKFIQSSTHANALTVVQMGGEGNLYENCSFTFGVVDNLDQTTAHEVLFGEDSGTFIKCTFGADTLLTSAARSVLHFDEVTASQEPKSNQFYDCMFSISSSSSTATFIRLNAVGDILFSNLFVRPVFFASVDSAGGAALAEAVQTGTSTVKGCIGLVDPAALNVTDIATATSGRNAAVQIVAVSPTAGTAGVGVQPTA